MSPAEPCEALPWDSEHFGLRIARFRGDGLAEADLRAAEAWCAERRIDCLYVLASAADPGAPRLPNPPFRPVDVRITLERRLSASAASAAPSAGEAGAIRLVRPEDLPALRRIARAGHTDSRFFFDPGFPDERCALLYERWIERSAEGWADAVLVAEAAGAAAGYVTCHLTADGGGIGLVGVGAEARGRGLGGRLLAGALDWFSRQGVGRVSVVTQARNGAAQRLYQRHGFVSRDADLWFHGWFGEGR